MGDCELDSDNASNVPRTPHEPKKTSPNAAPMAEAPTRRKPALKLKREVGPDPVCMKDLSESKKKVSITSVSEPRCRWREPPPRRGTRQPPLQQSRCTCQAIADTHPDGLAQHPRVEWPRLRDLFPEFVKGAAILRSPDGVPGQTNFVLGERPYQPFRLPVAPPAYYVPPASHAPDNDLPHNVFNGLPSSSTHVQLLDPNQSTKHERRGRHFKRIPPPGIVPGHL